MPDLNLFGESGFQNVTKTETILDNTKKQKHAEMPVQSQKVKSNCTFLLSKVYNKT